MCKPYVTIIHSEYFYNTILEGAAPVRQLSEFVCPITSGFTVDIPIVHGGCKPTNMSLRGTTLYNDAHCISICGGFLKQGIPQTDGL